jgi:hypothetical protein
MHSANAALGVKGNRPLNNPRPGRCAPGTPQVLMATGSFKTVQSPRTRAWERPRCAAPHPWVDWRGDLLLSPWRSRLCSALITNYQLPITNNQSLTRRFFERVNVVFGLL